MNAEIVSVGTELLLGQIVDTNAVYLSQMLSRLGITLYHRTTVGDNPDRMRAAFSLALSRADLVLVIGGLGPTEDDLSKEMAAEVTGIGLTEDFSHAQWLQERYQSLQKEQLPSSFMKQALVPREGRGLPNPNGTALGALFETKNKAVICLPGPPNELIPMTEQSVEPYLRHRIGGSAQIIRSRVLRVIGLGESLVEQRVQALMQSSNPSVAPYAKMGEVHLRITAQAASEHEADALIQPAEAALRAHLGIHVYGADEETLEQTLVQMLTVLGLTVSTAESCTGGLVAERITRAAGASHVFSEGFITYSNEAKQKYLHVTAEKLAVYGAVSSETAATMAQGARAASGADLAVSVTGIAGPEGGSEAKPVGLVHIGLASQDGTWTEKYQFLGSRTDVRLQASQVALNLVRRSLLEQFLLR